VRAPTETMDQSRTAVGSGELAAQVMQDAQRLVNLEIALARQEVKDLLMANAVAAALVAAGGLLLVLAVLVAVPVMVVQLVPWHWQAAAVWLAAYAVLGLVLALIGKARFRFELPTRTLDSLKENKEWALRQIRSKAR